MYAVLETKGNNHTDKIDKVISGLLKFSLERKPAYFCYGSIIQPCTFVDSFSYIYLVCCDFVFFEKQQDRLALGSNIPQKFLDEKAKVVSKGPRQCKPLPTLKSSYYVKWAGDIKGFGVFLASENLEVGDVAATFGGVITTYQEISEHKQCYTLGSYKLPNFRFRNHDCDAIVEGSSVWSGDGKLINHSCCPMLIPHKGGLSYYRKTGHNTTDLESDSKSRRSSTLKILTFQQWYV